MADARPKAAPRETLAARETQVDRRAFLKTAGGVALALPAALAWMQNGVELQAAPVPKALRFAGLWRSGDGSRQVLTPPLLMQDYIARRRALADQGLAARTMAVCRTVSGEYYVGVFEPTPEHRSVTHLMAGTWEQFAARDKELFDTGYRVSDIALSIAPKDARQVRYTAIWRKGLGTGAQWTTPAREWGAFAADAKVKFDQGLRLAALDAINVLADVQKGTQKALFTGTWRSGLGTGALYVIPPGDGPAYHDQYMKHFNNGLRSVAFRAFTLNGQTPIYTGVVSGDIGQGGERSGVAQPWDAFAAEHASRVKDGMRLVDVAMYREFTIID